MLIAPCPVEGLGLTLLEAMAGGLPVVAAEAAGHLDVLAGLDSRAMFPPERRRMRRPATCARSPTTSPADRTVARGAPASAGASSRCSHRPLRPRPSIGGHDDRPRRGVARGVGRRVAPQPAPRRGSAAIGCRAARALRRAARRPDARPAVRAASVVRAWGARGSGCRARPVVHGATGEVAAPPTRPARRRAPGAGRDARRRLARHAASAALDQRPRRGRARRAVGLADAVRHHRRLARGRPPAGRAAARRGERGPAPRSRRRGGGVLSRAGAPQEHEPVRHAHPQRRRCRCLPPPRAAAGGPARRPGGALPRHGAPRPHRRRPLRGDRTSPR